MKEKDKKLIKISLMCKRCPECRKLKYKFELALGENGKKKYVWNMKRTDMEKLLYTLTVRYKKWLRAKKRKEQKNG